MPLVIYTGDEATCFQLNSIQCPACNIGFELTSGPYVFSAAVQNLLKVCPKHEGKTLTEAEEENVRTCFQKALDHPRGRIQVDGKLIKTAILLKSIRNPVQNIGQYLCWNRNRRKGKAF